MVSEAIEFAMNIVMLLEEQEKPRFPEPPAEIGSRRSLCTVVSPSYSERVEFIAARLHDAAIQFQNIGLQAFQTRKQVGNEVLKSDFINLFQLRFAPVLHMLLNDIRGPYIDLRNDDLVDYPTCTVVISGAFQRLERERIDAARRLQQALSAEPELEA